MRDSRAADAAASTESFFFINREHSWTHDS